MTFALVAYLMVAGQVHAYQLDSAMTYEDCRASLNAGVSRAIIDRNGLSVDLRAAPLVCELETH